MTRPAQFGLMGLGVMGDNLALNIDDHGGRIESKPRAAPPPGAPRAGAGTVSKIGKEIVMKLDVRALALAAGTTAAGLFALCALFVALAPGATVWATRELFHLAVAAPPEVTATGALVGVVFWFAATAATAAALAGAYNRWARG